MSKIISVTAFTALLTFFKMLSGFAIAKVVAIYTGPTGMAMLGQVQSVIAGLNGVVTAPVGNGVVRYTAEKHTEGYKRCSGWWQASLQWAFSIFLLVLGTVLLFSKPISQFLFNTIDYYWVVLLGCLVLPLSIINTAFVSVINGQKHYKKYVSLGFISVTISTVLMVMMIYFYHIKGAFVAASLNTSIAGLVVFFACIKEPWFKVKLWLGRSSSSYRKEIGGYVVMAVTSAITTPIALILIRNILISEVGWSATGQWQAVWKISEVYLAIITMALSTYYLPQLASLKSGVEVRWEINKTARVILPVVIILALLVYLLRDVAIFLLFTSDFQPARDLFSVQLVGDVIKILAWLYAFPMLARGATRWFVFSEIFFSTTFVLISWIMISHLGVNGANWGYLLNYILYFIFV
ncbi:O-antigen translocase, partial [Cronobacter sakazakii]|nr:O-antigen translocase [Cronobacter sakazakii]